MTWTDMTQAGAPRKSADIWVATAFDTTTSPSAIYLYDATGYVQRSTDRGITWTKLSVDEGQEAFAPARDTHGRSAEVPRCAAGS